MISVFLWGGLAAASLLIGFTLAGCGLSNPAAGLCTVLGFLADAVLCFKE